MQLFKPYGWIHWDAESQSWHTVTGYYLGPAGESAEESDVPVVAAIVQEHPGLDKALADVLAEGLAGGEPAAPSAAPAGPVASAAGVPVAPAILEASVPAVPVQPRPAAGPPAPSSADHEARDTDHQRYQARADTQLAVNNARWDTQHTLDNARWDTRHTLDNARWDTSLAVKRSREDAALAADMALVSAVHGGYIATAQGSLDRAVQRATYVTTAAGAVGTLYTAVLAARYTVNHQAPPRSILPALFLGAAVAFSTWYMAFLRGQTHHQQLLVSGTGGNIAETRLLDFMEWTFAGVLARAWSLRASVISLGLGLALLPIGMVQLSSGSTWLIGIAAALLLVLWLAGETYIALRGPGVESYLEHLKRRPSRLAPAAPILPARPEGCLDPTGAPSYGMVHEPPAPPYRADDADPPPPLDVAAGLPPAPPQRADGANPPEPPEAAAGPPPAGPTR